MHVYFLRHADALPLEAPGVESEEERPLSDAGKKQVETLAAAWRRLGLPMPKIAYSPLRRARETAEGFRDKLGLAPDDVHEAAALAPGHTKKKLAKFLTKLEAEHLVLVGHEPDFSRDVAWLIGAKKARIDMAKAGVACIQFDAAPAKREGTLLWLITPEWTGA